MLSKWYIQQIVEWKILIVSKFDAEGKNLPNAKLRQNLGQNLKFLLYSNFFQHLSRINWELIIPLYAEFYDAELNSARILRAAELSPSGSVTRWQLSIQIQIEIHNSLVQMAMKDTVISRWWRLFSFFEKGNRWEVHMGTIMAMDEVLI